MSVGSKRMSVRSGGAVSPQQKLARAMSDGRAERTPTPVSLPESELHSIDGQLVLRMPVSSNSMYRGRTDTPRLHMQSVNTLPEDVMKRLSNISYDKTTANLAASLVIPMHAEMRQLLEVGD